MTEAARRKSQKRQDKLRRVRIQEPRIKRLCLGCDTPFTAKGKFNRLCNRCKQRKL